MHHAAPQQALLLVGEQEVGDLGGQSERHKLRIGKELQFMVYIQ